MEARIKNMHTILGEAWGPMVALGKSLALLQESDRHARRRVTVMAAGTPG